MSQFERIPSSNGRDIYLVTGRISQTVNICSEKNVRGAYDWTIRLPVDHFVTADEVRRRNGTDELVAWLTRERAGQLERSPSGFDIESEVEDTAGDQPIAPEAESDSKDSVWIHRAMNITEICINELVLEFLDLPYLHRVEHSIHTRLYSILSNQPHFDRHFPLAEGEMVTQAIHKEWPESIPRPEKGNRRGNFDLAILSPGQLNACSLDEFGAGRVAPAIVIEMGLNYKEGHLSHDGEKLLNSKVRHGYLVHLVRERPREPAIDETIAYLRSTSNIKVAFARVDHGHRYVKLLDDPVIRSV